MTGVTKVLAGKVRPGMRVRLYDRHTGRWVVVVAATPARPSTMPFWAVFEATDGRTYGANVADTFDVEHPTPNLRSESA